MAVPVERVKTPSLKEIKKHKSKEPKQVKEPKQAPLNFPYDLNNLCSLQYSFDTLKLSIEYLARQQSEHSSLIAEIMTREAIPVQQVTNIVNNIVNEAALSQHLSDNGSNSL